MNIISVVDHSTVMSQRIVKFKLSQGQTFQILRDTVWSSIQLLTGFFFNQDETVVTGQSGFTFRFRAYMLLSDIAYIGYL